MQPRKQSEIWFVLALIIVVVAYINACAPIVSENIEGQVVFTSPPTETVQALSSATFTPVITSSPTSTLTAVSTPTAVSTQISSFNPTSDTRQIAYYWREWPVKPTLSYRAQEIIIRAIHNPNLDLRAFSKVGDCQMMSDTFLGGFANGKYAVPEGYEETVIWFAESMMAESVTAANGLGINSVLNPLFGLAAGHSQCERNETPLDCELRTRRPAFVLIAMGTNWKPNGEISFEKHLRVVVDRVLETGALPILATKADNIEGDWKLNQAIAQVAYDYDLPLVNVWRAVQDLPNHGLVSPKNIYLTGDGWMRRNYAWLYTLKEIYDFITEQTKN